MGWGKFICAWNGRVNEFAVLHGIKLWYERCVQEYSGLALFIWKIDGGQTIDAMAAGQTIMRWQPAVAEGLVDQFIYGACSNKVLRMEGFSIFGTGEQKLASSGWKCCPMGWYFTFTC